MQNQLTELFGFFGRYGYEVFGREVSPPDDNAAAQLLRFAQGECTPEERAQVCELLKQNPAWLRWIADRVKSGRAAGRETGQKAG